MVTVIFVPLLTPGVVVTHPLVFAKVTLVRLLQRWNAYCPMLVTLFGIVTEVSLEQFWNA